MSMNCSSPRTKSSHIYRYHTTTVHCHIYKYCEVRFLITCPYYKSCDWRLRVVSLCAPSFKVKWPVKRKRRKRPCAEGTENYLVAKGQRRSTSWGLCRLHGRLYCQELVEMVQPYFKKLSGNGPGVCVALNLKLWIGRGSLMSVAGRLCEELHCNQSSFLSFYTLI